MAESVARGTETVTVEGGANFAAICENEASRAVPRLCE